MKSKQFRLGAADALLLALSLGLCLGARYVFHACLHEDGGFGACHWAQQAVVGLGGALSLLALARLFMSDAMRLGTDAAFGLFGLLAAFTPGGCIDLCMMPSMACRQALRPAALVLGVLIAAVAAADFLLRRRKARG